MAEISYRRHRFTPIVIQHAIWLYLRFALSYRDVEDFLAERGLDMSYETIRSWVPKFGPAIARRLRGRRPRPSNRSAASSYCIESGRDSLDCDGWVFKASLRLRYGTPCLEFDVTGKNASLLHLLESLRDQPRLPKPFRQHDLEEQVRLLLARATASTT